MRIDVPSSGANRNCAIESPWSSVAKEKMLYSVAPVVTTLWCVATVDTSIVKTSSVSNSGAIWLLFATVSIVTITTNSFVIPANAVVMLIE